jgi:hypothetical protein
VTPQRQVSKTVVEAQRIMQTSQFLLETWLALYGGRKKDLFGYSMLWYPMMCYAVQCSAVFRSSCQCPIVKSSVVPPNEIIRRPASCLVGPVRLTQMSPAVVSRYHDNLPCSRNPCSETWYDSQPPCIWYKIPFMVPVFGEHMDKKPPR